MAEANRQDDAPPAGPAAGAESPAAAGDPRAAAPGRPTGWRKWLFRLVAMTVVPAAFFLLLELGLRLFGYGFEPAFFVGVPGAEALTTNQKFAWRFFPPTGSRPPVPQRFSARKPAGTYRVFVFGGSAAMGSPEPAFSFPRILEAMLRQRYPGVRFEVVNAAMEAMNSHVGLVIAREAARREPDLFVLYMGNNEVVGPYGISDTFSSYTPSLGTIRTSIWVRSSRTGQLMHDVLHGMSSRPRIWKGMETFVEDYVPADDPRLDQARGHFRRNLADILAAGRRAGAKAIVCTVATNLKDCAPFASRHRAGLTKTDEARWRQLYRAGIEQAKQGRHAEALAELLAAAKIDDRYAELHFRAGRCCAALGQVDQAHEHFVRARDLDTLRFRADTRMNGVIREVARAQGEGVRFVDAPAAFRRSGLGKGGLIGEELFHEHCHMTFEGNWVLAGAVFREVAALLPKAIASRATGGADPPSADACADYLALTGWDRYRVATSIARVTARSPFTNQFDHAEQQARRRAQVERLRAGTLPAARDEAVGRYRRALARDADDVLLRASFAMCLYGFSDHAAAAEQWRTCLERLPGNAQFHKDLGLAMLQQGKFDEAREQFTAALRILPRDLNALNNLGAALLWQNKPDEAIERFRAVLRADPSHADAHTNLAIALAQRGEAQDARSHFAAALKSDGEHVGAHRNLAKLLAGQGEIDEAIHHLREAIRAREDHASHLDLAALLGTRQQPDEAMKHYRRAVELAPSFAPARALLGKALLARGQYEQAAEALRKAVALDENLADAHLDLGAAFQRLRKIKQATVHYAKAARLRPNDPDARERLAYVLLVQDELEEAIAEYRKVLALDSRRPEAHNNLAAALARMERIEEAILHFAAAVKLESTPMRHHNLATLLSRRGRDREAVVHYRRALRLRPGWAQAMEGLAWSLATAADERVRNGGEALRLARRACEMTGYKRYGMLDVLAAAQAEVGQFAEAVRTAERARSLAEAAGRKRLAGRIAQRVALYRAQQAFRRGAGKG